MKTINFDGIIVEYSTTDNILYSCHVKEHDLYFSARTIDMIERKAKAMIQSKENLLRDFPQYK